MSFRFIFFVTHEEVNSQHLIDQIKFLIILKMIGFEIGITDGQTGDGGIFGRSFELAVTKS